MNSEDKIYAEKILKHLCLGASIDGFQFGLSPATTKIHLTHYDKVDDDGGQIYCH